MIDASFIGYDFDILLEYDDGERDTVNFWFQGKVVSILNKNASVVDIKWREEGHSDSDHQTSIEKLPKMKCNPQKHIKGALRQDLYKLLSTDL